MAQPKIWALVDERAGNVSQVLGVADALGMEYEIKSIRFNPFVRLPNPCLWWNRLGVRADYRQVLSPPWPDIAITSARRLGLVAAYIKHRSPRTFTAQLQWPGYTGIALDLIATPRHDNKPAGGNVMLTMGAPHRVTPAKLALESEACKALIGQMPPPYVAVLLGGGNDPARFAQLHAQRLSSLCSDLVNAIRGTLLITSSRRTGTEMTQAMRKHLTYPHLIYDWKEGTAEPNPYFGFLAAAEAIIVTGDSVSMCSEACATGKPVFIYESGDFMSRKHKAFIQSLYRENLARPLNGEDALFAPSYRLDDAAAVALEIRRRLKA